MEHVRASIFASEHKEAKIDLFCIDPDQWRIKDMRRGKKDYIFFFDKFGRGWIIHSELAKLAKDDIKGGGEHLEGAEFAFCRARIECNPEKIRNQSTDILRDIKTLAKKIDAFESNEMKEWLQRKIGLKPEYDV